MKQNPLDDKTVKLLPEEGKVLFCTLDKRPYSEAIVEKEKVKYFKEIEPQN